MTQTASPGSADSCELRFNVSGMHCAACSSRLERVLSGVPGVANVTVSLATNTAIITANVEMDEERRASLATAVEQRTAELGFAAELCRPDGDGATVFQAAREDERRRLITLKTRLVPEFVFTSLLLLISMGHMWGLPLPAIIDPDQSTASGFRNALLQLLLTLPVVWSGRDFYRIGLPNIWRRTPNMDSLVALGTGSALVYSLWNTLDAALGNAAAIHDLYYESAAVLITLISLGKYLESLSRFRMSDAIGSLMRLAPETAWRVPGSREGKQVHAEEVPLASVVVGDLLQVRPGGRVPVDGQIEEGTSAVDASMLTGESMPIPVGPGDTVTGGTLNTTGTFLMRASHVGLDTALARIIRLVQEAQSSKAPIARLADRVSLIFVPAVMALAVVAGLSWLLWGHVSGNALPSDALRIFVAVLVVACPCALGLATPISIMVATGRGAQLGVLVRNGTALEQAGQLDVVVFDKTGTLTAGQPRLVLAEVSPAYSPDPIMISGMVPQTMTSLESMLIQLAASLEAVSEHPLARAVTEGAFERHLPLLPVHDFTDIPGRGVRGNIGEADKTIPVRLGNHAFLMEEGILSHGEGSTATGKSMGWLEERLMALADQGVTPLLLAVDGVLAGILGVSDPLRPETPSVVKRLREAGLRVVMLSGDNRHTAEAVARSAGIEEVIADVLPAGKEAVISELQASGLKVGMVGDGVNDAPALARAHVGMAMGSGMDVAVDAGDIVLLAGDSRSGNPLRGVVTALELSRAAVRNIRENLFWAFGYNILCIPVAAGILKLFGGPSLSPMVAGTAMAFSSVSVVLNALRLRHFKVNPF